MTLRWGDTRDPFAWRLFVLDDEPMAVDFYRDMFASMAAQPVFLAVARTSQDAARILAEYPPGSFDLLLFDLVVPRSANTRGVDFDRDALNGLEAVESAWRAGHRQGLFTVSVFSEEPEVGAKGMERLDAKGIHVEDHLLKNVDLGGDANQWGKRFGCFLLDWNAIIKEFRRDDIELFCVCEKQAAALQAMARLLRRLARRALEEPGERPTFWISGDATPEELTYWARAVTVLLSHTSPGSEDVPRVEVAPSTAGLPEWTVHVPSVRELGPDAAVALLGAMKGNAGCAPEEFLHALAKKDLWEAVEAGAGYEWLLKVARNSLGPRVTRSALTAERPKNTRAERIEGPPFRAGLTPEDYYWGRQLLEELRASARSGFPPKQRRIMKLGSAPSDLGEPPSVLLAFLVLLEKMLLEGDIPEEQYCALLNLKKKAALRYKLRVLSSRHPSVFRGSGIWEQHPGTEIVKIVDLRRALDVRGALRLRIDFTPSGTSHDQSTGCLPSP